ncbi:MAG TPA: class II aldolase/adducin family protein [Actinomycetes bacterium]|nr:class II aldolase/adducin family protein [Actinomycetes bacterium]
MDVTDHKRRLVNCLRIMEREGLFELTYGHMSCRHPTEQGRFLILGNLHDRGMHIADVTVDGIVTMDERGETLPGEVDGPGERFIHLGAYAARPDVHAVVHCHPPLSTSFSVAGVEILPVDHLGLIFTPSVPIHDYSGQVDTPQKGAAVAETLGDRTAVLLRSHGVAVVGDDIEKACLATLALERTAAMQLHASQIGTPRPVPPEYTMDGGRFSEGLDEKEYFETAWAYYAWKYKTSLM